MTVTFEPSRLRGTVTAPPSKSLSHRCLIAAALSEGESILENLCLCEDIYATVDCLRLMGAKITLAGRRAAVQGMELLKRPLPALPCRQSGSTLRFLLPLGIYLAGQARFTGHNRLMERGAGVYADALGITLDTAEGEIRARGQLTCGQFSLPGHISSQYITGLLLLLPLLGGGSVRLTTPAASRPYLDLTVDTLAKFGVNVTQKQDLFTVLPGDMYKANELYIEGDWSNGAFIHSLARQHDGVKVAGLEPNSRQGDRKCLDFFEIMDNSCPNIDITPCPDLAPVLMAHGAICKGITLYGTERLKNKESDRAAVMARELSKLGVTVRLETNRVRVLPALLHRPSLPIDSHDDHRIAMAMSLLLLRTGGVLTGGEAVAKSYPGFFDDLLRLGANIRIPDRKEE